MAFKRVIIRRVGPLFWLLDLMRNQSYINAWSDYKRRTKFYYWAWLGGAPVAFFLCWLLSLVHAPEWSLLLVALVWAIVFVYSAFRLQFFQCPRCHEKFFMTFWFYNPLSTKCVHCSLPKYQD
jgi:hypothetical protein